MASSMADCVFGVARLISSASKTLVKRGPGVNSNSFLPPPFSTTIWVPVMSAGIKSGVNCILLKSNPSALLKDLTRRVFPIPGTPSRRTCPFAKKAIKTFSTMSLLPTITLPISSVILSKSVLNLSISFFISLTSSLLCVFGTFYSLSEWIFLIISSYSNGIEVFLIASSSACSSLRVTLSS